MSTWTSLWWELPKMTETILEKIIYHVVWLFSLAHVPSGNMEKDEYELYCCQPPGGNGDALASLLRGRHVIKMFIESMVKMQSWNFTGEE